MSSPRFDPVCEDMMLAAFDAAPDHVVVIDEAGRIVAANRAWKRFAVENGADLGRVDVGADYFQACRNAAANRVSEADLARQGIEEVLAGRRPSFDLEYSSDAGDIARWFALTATPIRREETQIVGALISHRDITGSKQKERTLCENRDRLKVALSAARTGAWSVDLRTLQLNWSHEVDGLVGLPELGKALVDLERRTCPEDVPLVKEAIRAAIAERSEFACNFRIRDATDRIRSLSILGQVHCDAIGIPTSIAGTVHEISDVTIAERALEGQHRVLEVIARGAPLHTVLEEIVRLVEARLAGSRCSILVLDDSRKRLRFGAGASLPKAYNDLIDGVEIGPRVGSCGTAVYFERNVGVADIEHDPLWADYRDLALRFGLRSCHSVPIFGSSENESSQRGKVLGTFAVYRGEVGEPELGYASVMASAAHLAGVALERERAVRAALESEERFRLLVDGVRDHAIFLADGSGRIVTWNPGAERIFGYSGIEAIGSQIERLVPPGASADESAIPWLERAATEGRYDSDRMFLKRDGSCFLANAGAHVLRDRDGAVRGFAILIHDLTERQRLEAQLRQSQKMEAIGQLAGGVAHDFNNLLTVINGFSELVLAKLPAPDSKRVALTAIRDAGERAAALTRQLLAFSRQAVIEPKVLDLNAVVTSTVDLLRRLIGEDVEIVTDLSSAIGAVRADPVQVEQVLMNLAVNARDAMARGGRLSVATGSVLVERPRDAAGDDAPSSQPYVVLSVSDTGHGIPDDVKARIFEPFYTTKGVGKGTGLGLATVYGIVDQSGGHITVESEVGRGTTFRVYLPVVSAGQVEQFVPNGDSRASAAGSETILVVEDEQEVRDLARISLEMYGYRVLDASCGEEAISLARSRPGELALLVTDVVMPEMGGRELANALRESNPQLPVLFMSGYTDDALVRHDVAAATDAFLQKPFTPMTLARKVREVLDAKIGK